MPPIGTLSFNSSVILPITNWVALTEIFSAFSGRVQLKIIIGRIYYPEQTDCWVVSAPLSHSFLATWHKKTK